MMRMMLAAAMIAAMMTGAEASCPIGAQCKIIRDTTGCPSRDTHGEKVRLRMNAALNHSNKATLLKEADDLLIADGCQQLFAGTTGRVIEAETSTVAGLACFAPGGAAKCLWIDRDHAERP